MGKSEEYLFYKGVQNERLIIEPWGAPEVKQEQKLQFLKYFIKCCPLCLRRLKTGHSEDTGVKIGPNT